MGRVEDSYVCSSKTMLRAYCKRPETFRFKVLEYTQGSNKVLRKVEQKWLDFIAKEELLTTLNVQNGTVKYYNVKRFAAGGNGLGTNKGNSNIGGSNRYRWLIKKPDGTTVVIVRSQSFAASLGKRWSNLYAHYSRGRPGPKRGEWKDWEILKKLEG